MTGDLPGTTSSLTFVGTAMPLQLWSVLFLAAGITVAAGFLGRWPNITIAGLHVMRCTYAALAIGLIVKCVERGGDGFRTPMMFAIFAATCWSAALGYLNQTRTERALKAAS
ncbi:hypothetical protein L5G28_04665 [Gordonia sp. HY285]|uniref:hypothetical protein n=1 Tax=Gordonia liuliyuniae TaxID=2911517 RepID=UPI001F3B5BD8|nr:hypothetical protein [Gordonia liuliyuniae]MCF8609453.1 hypothetical protein [Gordonia liuliyuniae]